MLLPIRTNVRCYRTPYANYAIIAVNVIVFLLSYWPDGQAREILRPWAERFVFMPAHPFLWQFITYAFLHGDMLHIFGNMFFLYIFGNNVNDKLGHFGYTVLLLSGRGIQRGWPYADKQQPGYGRQRRGGRGYGGVSCAVPADPYNYRLLVYLHRHG